MSTAVQSLAEFALTYFRERIPKPWILFAIIRLHLVFGAAIPDIEPEYSDRSAGLTSDIPLRPTFPNKIF
jgi:hypothetical protein